jgi:FkbM family methyltransferase
VLLDIGANLGRMAIPRVVLGDFERAYCAEPDPVNFAALVRNVVSNGLRGLVLPDQVAIGSTNESAQLHRARYPGGHTLNSAGQAHAETVEVPCWTLDAWCGRLSIDPELVSYVKVDTQGWEGHVLRGASALLAHRHIAWQLEVQPALLEAAGTPVDDFYERCAERFTHFIDLDKVARGPRPRRTRELPEALEYLIGRKAPTDIVLFNASEHLDRSH